ncbi:UDP-N-acetylenolpyruvoylglucosamine reductase [Desulfonema limicola]|uniref:UDP-N-acetylenolpyruvoylglucosamine reductase n=1 Tax=Desulfonema limicola TaxID=45656 RepID=A0A975BB60_9BACT|nr:UDP-N-acetylmuramate dehydrogenase [Desulfonema limicola]QTA82082.1 UDP-N-acetylenolpyruvoylglucosamine reductase [Desulfonema limicola]
MIECALDPDTKKWLKDFLGDMVRFDEPMSKHTSFRVGGPAEAYVKVQNIEDLAVLVKGAYERNLPWHIIGDGTNLLVKDQGVKGIVIVLKGFFTGNEIDWKKDDSALVKCMAGFRIKNLCRLAAANRLKGMNPVLGIPGTVGGGIVMNAGNDMGAISDVLDSVTFMMADGKIKTISAKNLCFKYRKLLWDSGYKEKYGKFPVILQGIFRLCISSKSLKELEQEAWKILSRRKEKQPLEFPSAGCFFKNPLSGEPAGKLIDLAGLKGKTAGGAQISPKHANFIINRNNASCSDILELAETVKQKVADMFGVILKSEVRILE